MTKRQFVTVCFRMFAVYLALGALTNIPHIYSFAISNTGPFGVGTTPLAILTALVLTGLSFFWPWLFWKKSDYLMLKVFGDKDFYVDEKGERVADTTHEGAVKFTFTSDEVLSIGLTLFGVWMVVQSLFPALAFIVNLFNTNTRDYYFSGRDTRIFLLDACNTLGQLILGYALIRKSDVIVNSIHKLHNNNT